MPTLLILYAWLYYVAFCQHFIPIAMATNVVLVVVGVLVIIRFSKY